MARVLRFLAAFFALAASSVSSQGGQSVTLAWDPSPDTDVAGYVVRYGTNSGSYPDATNLVGIVTSATISGLAEGVTYYFVVACYNTSGLESDPSNEIGYTVPKRSQPLISAIPNQSTLPNTPITISFRLGNVDTPAASLALSVVSSDPSLVPGANVSSSLVPNANVSLGWAGTDRTVTIIPAPDQVGTARISITVSNATSIATASFLLTVAPKIDRLNLGPNSASIQFFVFPNTTYTVQYKESLTAGRWSKIADVDSLPFGRVETVLDPFPTFTPSRWYRLVTPRLPDEPNLGPAILTSPQSVCAAVGEETSFRVVAFGVGPLSYQWLFNGTNLPGATASALVINSVQWSDSGHYAVVVTDQTGSQTSDAVVLALKPLIVAQPQSQSVFVTGGMLMYVEASANGPLAYRWFHNGNFLLGQTNAFLVLPNVQPADAGDYSVLVTCVTPVGNTGTVSSNATLTVLPGP